MIMRYCAAAPTLQLCWFILLSVFLVCVCRIFFSLGFVFRCACLFWTSLSLSPSLCSCAALRCCWLEFPSQFLLLVLSASQCLPSCFWLLCSLPSLIDLLLISAAFLACAEVFAGGPSFSSVLVCCSLALLWYSEGCFGLLGLLQLQFSLFCR